MRYTSPTEIRRDEALARALIEKKMGKHGAGGRTGLLDGLAHLVDQYYGGKAMNKVRGADEQNTQLREQEMGALANSLKGVPYRPMDQLELSHPDARNIQLAQMLKSGEGARDHERAKELQMLKNQGSSNRGDYYSGHDVVLPDGSVAKQILNNRTGEVHPWGAVGGSGGGNPLMQDIWAGQPATQTPQPSVGASLH